MRGSFTDIVIWVGGLLLFAYWGIGEVWAFTRLKSGFETITETYLIPLSNAVAGAAFILYVILSYFQQDEYSKKLGGVITLAICGSIGLEIMKAITQTFGGY